MLLLIWMFLLAVGIVVLPAGNAVYVWKISLSRVGKMAMFEKLKDYYLKHEEIINYLIFGVLTTAVNWIVFQVFNALFLVNWGIANVIAWIAAVIFAYVTNRKHVFRSANPRIIKEFFLFVQARLLSLLLEMLIMYVLIEIILLAPFSSKVITAVAVVIMNYLFSKLIVFKERKQNNGSD